jgi:hypothetical protein
MSTGTRKARASTKYYHAHKERVSARAKQWAAANPEKVKAKRARYLLRHPGRINALAKVWRRNNRDRIRDSHLRRTFGITLAQFNAVNEFQSGLCAICDNPPNGKYDHTLYVDHDHKTGRIRGLICDNCNVVLGRVNDSSEILSRMITYLESPEAAPTSTRP